jgi:hypothetical protein
MRTKLAIALIVLVGTTVAYAQPRGDDGPRRGGRDRGGPGDGPGWRARDGEFGGPGGPGGPGGRGPRGPMPLRMMAERLADRLELSDEQMELYNAVVAEYETQLTNDAETPGNMRGLREEFRAAREAGDEARIAELREQARAFRAQREALVEGFFESIDPILDENQRAQLSEHRERMQRRREGMRQRMEMRRMASELPDQLGMSDEQRELYGEILDARRAERDKHREQMRAMRPVWEELREARQAGDADRVAELEAQLEAARPEPPDLDSFFESVNSILTEDQQAQLAAMRQQVMGDRAERGRAVDMQTVVSAAKRLNLSAEQREQLKEIMRSARQAERGQRVDRATRAELAARMRAEISAILTAEQRTEFDRLLDNHGRRDRERRDRGPRERQGRRGGSNPDLAC